MTGDERHERSFMICAQSIITRKENKGSSKRKAIQNDLVEGTFEKPGLKTG
jgi:hypothetical protein